MKTERLIFIFDFDGVIVDSVGSLYDAYIGFLKKFGIEGYKEEFNLLNGPKISDIVSFLKVKYSIKDDEGELLSVYCKMLSSVYKNSKLNDGIKDILNLLRSNDIKIALASSSKKEDIESVLNRYELIDYFEFIVTGDDVENAKPSPEIYNTVKKKYPNHDYFVVEDSVNGLQSAIKAGMKTILYNPSQENISVEATYEIYSLKQIKNIITEIDLNCFTVAKAQEIALKVISHDPNINTQKNEVIEKLWNNELKRRKLFNGNIVSYKSHKKNNNSLTIDCFITQYKYFFAQLRNPELNLGIIPIGVSGVIIDKDNNTLLAMRHNVTEYEGFYEFLPAGSIDSSNRDDDDILFQEQLITEFEEETKIVNDIIQKIEPCCLILDKNHQVYDICSKIYINGLINDLIKSEQNEEYKNIQTMNLGNIHNKIEEINFVPTSVIIFNNLDL